MSEHTPGRIQLAKEFDGHIMTMDGLAVSDCCLDYSSLDHDQQVSNARRLVACWNACEGISTETLELVPRFTEAGIKTVQSVEAQRDELMAKMEHVAARLDADGDEWGCAAELRAAIAKVKGGAL